MSVEPQLRDKIIAEVDEIIAEHERAIASQRPLAGTVGRSFEFPLPGGVKAEFFLSVAMSVIGIHRPETESSQEGVDRDGGKSPEIEPADVQGGATDVLHGDTAERTEGGAEARPSVSVDP
jgi:hypothetical protein